MSFLETVYEAVVLGLRGVAPLAYRGEGKVARGLRARRGAAEHLVRWGREGRGEEPLVWFHAPSVGEGLQALLVMERLRAARPGIQLVYTHFSPSAEPLARRVPARVAGYLPWDVRGEVGPVLDTLRPELLVFTKTEVWPVLSREAERRGIPMALVAATLPEGAGRLGVGARTFLRSAFGRLGWVGAISPEDGERFRLLGVRPDRIEVTGDPGVDSAWLRARAADPDAPHLRPFREMDRFVVVAGSTWPADEEVLTEALVRVREGGVRCLAVVAPHEPTPEHVEGLTRRLEEAGLRADLLGRVEEEGLAGEVEVVVVDRVGVLAELYTVGHAAYVGGGFHDAGLHSVLEPAAAGLPVVFGPRHRNARAADDLLRREGAREVASAGELGEVLGVWGSDEDVRRETGRRALAYMEEHRGAGERTVALLETLLPPS